MLCMITKQLLYFARSVKHPSKRIDRRPQNVQKIKLTEQQISLLGPSQKQKNKPSVEKVFAEKYAQKFKQLQQQYLTGQKKQKPKKKDIDYQFYNKPINKHSDKSQRIQPEEMSLKDLASVRLGIQYLPLGYLKQAQKIFHKYGPQHLRMIAQDFTKLMRLRYSEQKLNYDQYQDLGFQRLEQKIPKDKQIEQIYLIGEQKIYDDYDKVKNQHRRIDQEAFDVNFSYTQNIAVSYLLNRSPRTFATAVRVMTQIKYKYPEFKPKSFLDFGAGLASGASAFIDIFQDTGQVYCVQPASKMRKLGKYLTQGTQVKYYQSLGEMSVDIKQTDIVYAGYVINQLKPELVQVYLQALYAKVKNQGFLVITQYGSPYGSRLMHQTRRWALQKNMYIAAPCPHHLKCPLRSHKSWCHFDQPSGVYPSQIFGKLPTQQAVRVEKFSYLILQKKQDENDQIQTNNIEPNVTKDWQRILFPIMKRGRHVITNLCTKDGLFERRISSKSHGPEYKQIKKLKWGDYWRFGKRIPNRYRKQRRTGLRLW